MAHPPIARTPKHSGASDFQAEAGNLVPALLRNLNARKSSAAKARSLVTPDQLCLDFAPRPLRRSSTDGEPLSFTERSF